jgi:hypothetical protein
VWSLTNAGAVRSGNIRAGTHGLAAAHTEAHGERVELPREEAAGMSPMASLCTSG